MCRIIYDSLGFTMVWRQFPKGMSQPTHPTKKFGRVNCRTIDTRASFVIFVLKTSYTECLTVSNMHAITCICAVHILSSYKTPYLFNNPTKIVQETVCALRDALPSCSLAYLFESPQTYPPSSPPSFSCHSRFLSFLSI